MTAVTPKVYWFARQPTPYNDFLFASLAKQARIDLTVYFMDGVLPSHPWKAPMAQGFPARYYRRLLGVDARVWQLAAKPEPALFVIGGYWYDATVLGLINLLIARNKLFVLWTDTPSLTKRRSLPQKIFRKALLSYLFHHAYRVMGTGEVALQTLGQMGCDAGKLVNFPFFIDLDHFSPMIDSSRPESMVFLSSGRLLNAVKGHDLAMRALAEARRKTGRSVLYRLAGDGPDKSVLQALAADLDLDVEFCDWLELDRLPDFYRSGHVLLHPSHHDPYPVAVLEAMASGLVVIASDRVGAAVDRIIPAQNGFIHRAGDAEDLAEKIADLLQCPEKLVTMGAQARRTAEQWPVSRAAATIEMLVENVS